MRRAIRFAAAMVTVTSLAAGQSPPTPPAPAKPDAPRPDEKPAPPAPIVDTPGDATKLVAAQQKGLTDKEPRTRADAIAPFLLHRNELYVKTLAPFLKDANEDVAKAAARALGNQPFPKASEALLDFASNKKLTAVAPGAAAEALLALQGTGLGKKGYERLRALFDDADPQSKTAIFRVLAALKEKKAFSFFVDYTDEPHGDTSSANNPPASYWKARFTEWNDYKQYVRRGLKELSGQSLATAAQWIEWAKTPEAKKAGLVYERGS